MPAFYTAAAMPIRVKPEVNENLVTEAWVRHSIITIMKGMGEDCERINALGDDVSALAGKLDRIVRSLKADQVLSSDDESSDCASDGEQPVVFDCPGYTATASPDRRKRARTAVSEQLRLHRTDRLQ